MQDNGFVCRLRAFEEATSGRSLGSQEADKAEGIGRQARGGEECDNRARPWERRHDELAAAAFARDAEARVADARGAGIGDQGDDGTALDFISQFDGDFLFVVLVVGQHRLIESEVAE